MMKLPVFRADQVPYATLLHPQGRLAMLLARPISDRASDSRARWTHFPGASLPFRKPKRMRPKEMTPHHRRLSKKQKQDQKQRQTWNKGHYKV